MHLRLCIVRDKLCRGWDVLEGPTHWKSVWTRSNLRPPAEPNRGIFSMQNAPCHRLFRTIIVVSTLCLAVTALADEGMVERTTAARQTSVELLQTLAGKLKAQLEKDDPAAAVRVCRDIAPAISNSASRESGWRVTRVGTRVRNPMLGMPDSWEQEGLADFASRAAKGETFAEMEYTGVVKESDGSYFRYMKPIGTKSLCLMCHGTPDQIPEAVKAVLNADYPHDAAINYKAGELRGAVSIKQPIQPDK